jgi:hypothetical protein
MDIDATIRGRALTFVSGLLLLAYCWVPPAGEPQAAYAIAVAIPFLILPIVPIGWKYSASFIVGVTVILAPLLTLIELWVWRDKDGIFFTLVFAGSVLAFWSNVLDLVEMAAEYTAAQKMFAVLVALLGAGYFPMVTYALLRRWH